MELEPLEFLRSTWFLTAMGMLVAALHVCLTKSDVKLGLARLLEKYQQHKHVMTQRELDRKRRFEKELLRSRIEIFGMVQRLAIHMNFLLILAAMHKLAAIGGAASCMQLLGTLGGYCLHVFIASGVLEIESASHIRFIEAVCVSTYAMYLCGVVQETELEMFSATEKVSQVTMVLLSVVFIDVKMPLPVYMCGAVVLSYKQFQLIGLSNVKPMLVASTLVSHTAACGVVTFIVFAMQSHIAGKLDSKDISSLLVASRRVLRGVCDGDLVLDSRNHNIVDDGSCLERLLKTPKKLADTSFLDLFLDPEGRQHFLQFLRSETAPGQSQGIPPCLRIALQGAEGPVSTDVFCTSVAAAGEEYYLMALRADPDQFIAPPDAQADPPRPVPEHHPPGMLGFDRAATFLLHLFPGMDIEEVGLSFLRHPRENGMPTLRSFIRIDDWPRVEDFFQTALSPSDPSVEDMKKHNKKEKKIFGSVWVHDF